MTPELPEIELERCTTCHHRFLPADGVCPRCASPEIEPFRVPAVATVLASTELTSPSEGWPSPHRLALVELAESVRLLVVASAPLPEPGESVEITKGPGHYTARPGGSR